MKTKTAKTRALSLLAACGLFFWCAALPAAAAAREKVILDTDMVEMFDDGVAMLMLATAPEVDLIGVTTLSGNSWVQDGTAIALRQLELVGAKVPVAAGLESPLRPDRYRQFKTERQIVGVGHDTWVGSFGLEKPESWRAAYEKRYGAAPKLAPADKHAVNFIIDTVRANPGEVTIAAIGPCGNLALALRMAPDIAPLVKRVIYMGGSFFQQGNVTPAAEFNWYFDPEAARIALRGGFKEQIILGLDVCEKVVFKKEHYDRQLEILGKSPFADLLRGTFVGQMFEKDAAFTHFVWDALVAAVIIDPGLITAETERPVDVNDQWGMSYGQSLAFGAGGPEGAAKARIVTDMDVERFWKMLDDSLARIAAPAK